MAKKPKTVRSTLQEDRQGALFAKISHALDCSDVEATFRNETGRDCAAAPEGQAAISSKGGANAKGVLVSIGSVLPPEPQQDERSSQVGAVTPRSRSTLSIMLSASPGRS